MFSRYHHNMVNFGPLTAEISLGVWGTPANFNGFRILAALLHSSQVVSISQTLRRWAQGATYVWRDDHHVGHWPTFLLYFFRPLSNKVLFQHRHPFNSLLSRTTHTRKVTPVWILMKQ